MGIRDINTDFCNVIFGTDGFYERLPTPELPDEKMLGDSASMDSSNDSKREVEELPAIIEADKESEGIYSPLLSNRIKEQREMSAPSMEVQAERIKELYESIPELQFEKWKSFDINERKKVLDDFEKGIAKIEKRISMPVEYERLSAGVMGYTDGCKLVVSERILMSNEYADYKETLNTLFHEGRHSYQNYNLYVHRTEQSDETFNAWVANREKLGYSSGNVSFPFNLSEIFRQKSFYQYYTQPVEVDARLFAETVERKIGL